MNFLNPQKSNKKEEYESNSDYYHQYAILTVLCNENEMRYEVSVK